MINLPTIALFFLNLQKMEEFNQEVYIADEFLNRSLERMSDVDYMTYQIKKEVEEAQNMQKIRQEMVFDPSQRKMLSFSDHETASLYDRKVATIENFTIEETKSKIFRPKHKTRKDGYLCINCSVKVEKMPHNNRHTCGNRLKWHCVDCNKYIDATRRSEHLKTQQHEARQIFLLTSKK